MVTNENTQQEKKSRQISGKVLRPKRSMTMNEDTIKTEGTVGKLQKTKEEYKKKNNLDLYEEIFEKPFLKATGEYYTEEASKLMHEGNISAYMGRVIQKIDAENVRSRKFLYPSSFTKVCLFTS